MNQQDKACRAAVEPLLPPGALTNRPEDTLAILPLLIAVGCCNFELLAHHHGAWINLLLALILGNTYAALFCFGHYLAHGSMTRTKWLRELLLYPCFWMIGMSPHLWKSWHHALHHQVPNENGKDPDCFGTIAQQKRRPIPNLFIPGNGRLIPSLFFLLTFFTGHVLTVLFVYARSKAFVKASRLNRKRAFAETAALLLSIGLLGWFSKTAAVFTVLLPWLVANAIVVSYTVTQHFLCPSPPNGGAIVSTMSVRAGRFIDTLHFYNSHHVEHHLFPEAPIKTLPLIRKALKHLNTHPDYVRLGMPVYRFMCPKWWVALLAVFYTPRFHSEDGQSLVDHKTGRVVTHNFIDYVLRHDGPFHYIKP